MGGGDSQTKLAPPVTHHSRQAVPGLGALVNLAALHLGATHPTTNPFGPSAHHGSFLPTGHLTGRCPRSLGASSTDLKEECEWVGRRSHDLSDQYGWHLPGLRLSSWATLSVWGRVEALQIPDPLLPSPHPLQTPSADPAPLEAWGAWAATLLEVWAATH